MNSQHRAERLKVLDHPVALETLTLLRQPECETVSFREGLRRLSRMLAITATEELPLTHENLLTPLGVSAPGYMVQRDIVIIPVLRAGIGMVDGFLDIVPRANVGFLGLARDEETLNPTEYYRKFPRTGEASIFVLDPMLATGGSACAAIGAVNNGNQSNISLITILAAPEGIQSVQSTFPDVSIVTAAIDDSLDEKGFILPGLGDAGDRLWGTE